MKYYFIADAMFNGKSYATGKSYDLTPAEYANVKSSCKPADQMKVDFVKGVSTRTLVLEKIQDYKRIMVIKPEGLGNVVSATPMIRALKKQYPAAKIDLLINDSKYIEAFKGWKYLNKVVGWDKYEDEANDYKKYDLVIEGIPGQFNKLIPAHKTIQGNNETLKTTNEVQANLDILKEIGINDVEDKHTYINKVNKGHSYTNKNCICICAGYLKRDDDAWNKKNWGYKKYAQLIEKLKKKYPDHRILILGTDDDVKVFKEYKKTGPDVETQVVYNLVDQLSVSETAYIISMSDFLVSNDTALMHIAAAVGTQVFAIFGCTSIIKNKPLYNTTVISRHLECSPCQYKPEFFTCETNACMDISVDEVFKAITCKNGFELKKNKYTIGIMTTTYNRFELLSVYLLNILNNMNYKDVKICIMDDGSTDGRINKLCKDFKKEFKGGYQYLRHTENGGKQLYYKLCKIGFSELMDCKYILNLQEDSNFNPGFYDVLKKSGEYFKNKEIKAITFFRDSRLDDPNAEGMKIKTIKEHDRYFDEIETIDGLCIMLAKDFIINMDWDIKPTEYRTMIFRSISQQLLKYKTLCLKESLITHTGNAYSKFWPDASGRRCVNIYALNLNLFNKPNILKSKEEFYYGPDWYSNTYHAKGDFYLKGKTLKQVSDKWEKKGYKKRMHEVFDDVDSKVFRDKNGLEVACHWGRAMFWLYLKYPVKRYDGFDFSKTAIDWANKQNKARELTFKIGDCADFPFKKQYDFITCMDVVEHLPQDTYLKMIDEIDSHLKPGGSLILYGGTHPLPEHINIKSKEQLIEDFDRFELVKELKHDHLLFKKSKVSKVKDGLNYNFDYWDERYGKIGGMKTVGHKDWNDQEYQENNKKTFDFLDTYIDNERRPVILDFGCGICRFKRYLEFKFDSEVYNGFDIAEAVINQNNSKSFGDFYLLKDYTDISSNISSVNLIWTAFVLQHVIDDNLLLNYFKEFYKVLADNGRMIFLETSEHWEGDGIPYMKKRTLDDYKRLLHAAGFTNVEEKGRLKLKGTLFHSLIFVTK